MLVPESAFLHHTVLKSCVQGVVVVPNKKTSFLYIFSRGCDCTQHENIITNPAIVTHWSIEASHDNKDYDELFTIEKEAMFLH